MFQVRFASSDPRPGRRHAARHASFGLGLLMLGTTILGCSSNDLSDMEQSYPNLVDIPSRPTDVASAGDTAAIILSLEEEARARASEGYQGPMDPAPAPKTEASSAATAPTAPTASAADEAPVAAEPASPAPVPTDADDMAEGEDVAPTPEPDPGTPGTP